MLGLLVCVHVVLQVLIGTLSGVTTSVHALVDAHFFGLLVLWTRHHVVLGVVVLLFSLFHI